ncbi:MULTISPECIES: sulfurtransferase [Mycolicibacterium]|uniref:sulfurtransferase n=1 Tax=Mycolicibacterium TaxID=1866885 RepID=UPI000567249B|nr:MULTISPECIES: sulfurtransferase [Mycolicibacterium]MDW5611641.1 sulfurtransferase [Mycolicibacterium sp. D5.8-2]QZY45628.1 sulfurtransferase [Mycolicibacterium austroafricanum]UJL30766.1 sulfurtransferase [Mycolicibacterium vanbaalenii]WND56125.1 sulfurtransferase [Mycolicibacterium vanbaalenii]
MTRADIFITAAELARLIAEGAPVNVLDVRWELTRPDGREAYTRGHVPGAVYVSLEDELSDHAVTGRGRHPLPSGDSVESAARRWGLRRGVPTVVYDDWNRAGSARAWWVLTAAGIGGVRILDGGLAAWTAAGGRLETGVPAIEPGDVAVEFRDLYRGALPALTAEDVTGFDGVLLDARAPERFRGDTEPVDRVAGHIPGARNAPSVETLSVDGTFLPDDELVRYFRGRGATEGGVGVYCGSGVTAAVTIAALRATGVEAKLFPGSWSQWSADASRPVATGE